MTRRTLLSSLLASCGGLLAAPVLAWKARGEKPAAVETMAELKVWCERGLRVEEPYRDLECVTGFVSYKQPDRFTHVMLHSNIHGLGRTPAEAVREFKREWERHYFEGVQGVLYWRQVPTMFAFDDERGEQKCLVRSRCSVLIDEGTPFRLKTGVMPALYLTANRGVLADEERRVSEWQCS